MGVPGARAALWWAWTVVQPLWKCLALRVQLPMLLLHMQHPRACSHLERALHARGLRMLTAASLVTTKHWELPCVTDRKLRSTVLRSHKGILYSN